MIYLDHNATTPVRPEAVQAMEPFLSTCWGNPSSFHRLGRQAREALHDLRQRFATCVGARDHEIVFTAGGTEADNLALRGAARARNMRGHIIVSAVEHPAVLRSAAALAREGLEVSIAPVAVDGRVDPSVVADLLREDTFLVSVMHANNETGVIEPVEEIGALVREHGALFHVDAVQSFCKIPVDVQALGADLVSFSGHKIYGPRGVGALVVRQDLPLDMPLRGGSQEGGRRPGTENLAGIAGMVVAAEHALAELENDARRMARLRDRLERQVTGNLDGCRINGQGAPRVPNTTNIAFAGVDGESVLLHLDLKGICASSGSACTTGAAEPSHVLRAMGLQDRLARGAIRLSLGRDNTEEQVDVAADVLRQTIVTLRGISGA